MTTEDFRHSLTLDSPPASFPEPLRALWWDARGDWPQAHAQVDELATVEGMAVHAYLHRKEGEQANAGYWYARAARPVPSTSLAEEFERLLDALVVACGKPGSV